MTYAMRQISILLVLYHSSYQQSGSSENDPTDDEEFDCESLHCFSQLGENGLMPNHTLSCQMSENISTNQKLFLCSEDEEEEEDKCSKMVFKKHRWSKTKPFNIITNYIIKQLNQTSNQFCKYDLRKIVKPDPPFDVNVTYQEDAEEFLVRFKIQKIMNPNDNLFHEVVYQCKGSEMKNISNLKIEQLKLLGKDLQPNCNYKLKVRTIPNGDYFSGFWSEWSPEVNFSTPSAKGNYIWNDALLPVSVSTSACVIFVIIILIYIYWDNRIKPCIWPNIPTPKGTLEQLYRKPIKEACINFTDECFIDTTIDRVEKIGTEEVMTRLLNPSATEDTGLEVSHDKEKAKEYCHQMNCDATFKTVSVTLDTQETLHTSDNFAKSKENVSHEVNSKLSHGIKRNSAGDSKPSGSPQMTFPSEDNSAICSQQLSGNQSQTEEDVPADNLSALPEVSINNVTHTTVHDEAYVTMSSFYKTQ